jgi:hypothetical protein
VSLYVSLSDNLKKALFPLVDGFSHFFLEVVALVDGDNAAHGAAGVVQ